MRKLFFIVLLSCVVLSACSKKDGLPRRIQIVTDRGEELSTVLQVPLDGGDFSLEVQAESPIDVSCFGAPGTDVAWFELLQVQQQGNDSRIDYRVQPLLNTLDRRSLSLNLSAPSSSLGAFLSVRQGYKRIWTHSFATLTESEMKLSPGEVWDGPVMEGISSTYACYITLSLRSESASPVSSCPLMVTLTGGGVFEEIDRTSFVVDAPCSAVYTSDGYVRLRISNGGTVFSSESSLKLSVEPESEGVVYVKEICLYEIPVSRQGIIGTSDDDEE